ncbi:MAG: hypothetical protein MPK62_09440 [Alphaproteobacteria bacterium]|nr:hypothetical protein [Alphaproteobacteria bacterium]
MNFELPNSSIKIVWIMILLLGGGLIFLAEEVYSLALDVAASKTKLDYIHADIRDLKTDTDRLRSEVLAALKKD